jgi:hypothetical protein
VVLVELVVDPDAVVAWALCPELPEHAAAEMTTTAATASATPGALASS